MQPDEHLEGILSHWQQAFEQGEDLPAARLCEAHPNLLPEVERRIDALRQMGRLARAVAPDRTPPVESELPQTATALPGGPRVPLAPEARSLPALPGFDLQEELGRGGMGVVYRAFDTRLQRTVAIKQLLVGRHASADQTSRFRTEAQALARLRHPNIVQVFDCGEHDGQPFFVLEYCPGGSLGDRLRGAPLPPTEAAVVCERLAEAVQAAHANRIIHRDLKPTNVLLADSPEAPLTAALLKVSDFGLAKKMDEAGLSGSHDVVGTPSYMAPEQVRSRGEVGPAADVYSLGAILYELLTGRPPFKAATAMETLMQVVEDDPVSPRALNRKVPRDLETICLKCLRKEPGRRYPSAAELAADLRRFLDDQPVHARPVGPVERFVRWCGRNPRVAVLAAALLLLLVGTLVSVTALYLQADAQRRRAEANEADALAARQAAELSAAAARDQETHARSEADKARNVIELLTVIFEGADTLGLGNTVFTFKPLNTPEPTALEVIERGAELVDSREDLPPEVRATLLDTIGTVYLARAQYAKGEKYIREGYELRRGIPNIPPLDLANSFYHLGRLQTDRGGHRDAEKNLREALRLFQEHGADAMAVSGAQMNLGLVLVLQSEPEQAEPLLREAIERRRAILGDDHLQIAAVRLALATCYIELGQWTTAISETEKATRVIREKAGNGNLGQAIALFQDGVFKSFVQDDHSGAETSLKESLRLSRLGFGERHIYTTFPLFQLGSVYEQQGKLQEAEAAYRECLVIVRERQAFGHPRVYVLIENLAELLEDWKEADRLLTEGIEALRKNYGDDHVVVADALVQSAGVRVRRGDYDGEEKDLVEATRIYAQARADSRHRHAVALNNLAWVRRDQDRMDEAADLFRQSLEVEYRRGQPAASDLAVGTANLLDCRMTQGYFDAEVQELLGKLEEATRKLAWRKEYNLAYSRLLVLRAWNHQHYGRHAEAAADAILCRKRNAKNLDVLYRAACVLAGCAVRAANADLPLAEQEALTQSYTREALTTLRRAVRDGYANRSQIQKDPELAPLRQHPDYAALLKELTAKAP